MRKLHITLHCLIVLYYSIHISPYFRKASASTLDVKSSKGTLDLADMAQSQSQIACNFSGSVVWSQSFTKAPSSHWACWVTTPKSWKH